MKRKTSLEPLQNDVMSREKAWYCDYFRKRAITNIGWQQQESQLVSLGLILIVRRFAMTAIS